jgi:uncharacterized protein YifN (PemK superfamily)
MSASYILKIGEILNVDFTKYIPDLHEDIPEEMVNEPEVTYERKIDPLQMVVSLDGTEDTLQKLLDRLTRVNRSLRIEAI